MEAVRILIIDDEKVIRDGVERALAGAGYQITKAASGEIGIELIERQGFDIVLLDLMMPGVDGFTVLDWVKEKYPHIQVIVITGFATVSKAVSAMKQGAFDFVGKPFSPDYIRVVVNRAIEKIHLEAEAVQLREERILSLAAIDHEQSRLKTVFSCMAEAVIITDHKGVVVHHNPAAVKVLEIQTDPIVGKALADSIHDSDAVRMVIEAMSKDRVVTREFPPGVISRRYLWAHCAPVKDERGEIIGSVTVFEDISNHKEIDKMKSSFVSMVAHELKSPLASIEQMIYALPTDCKYESEKLCNTFHGRIIVRTKDLLRLIDNLLNLSKMESGTVVFNLEPINGHALIEEVLEIAEPQTANKAITLVYKPCDQDWWFNVDYDQIRTAFMNVLSNAVKYTPEGGTLEVYTSLSGGFANLVVKDSGIGIGEENLPYIFDRFYRVKGRETRHIPGSGLGLSLVKEVVDAHNGFIDVESQIDKGTTFTLSFPVTDVSRHSREIRRKHEKSPHM